MKPVTPVGLAAFFTLATLLTAIVSITMAAPAGPLDAIWAVKPYEHEHLLRLRPFTTAGFVAICAAMAAAAFGTLRRRRWGLSLATAIFVINAIGDAARTISGAWLSGLLGLIVAGAVVWWLTRPDVRALFR